MAPFSIIESVSDDSLSKLMTLIKSQCKNLILREIKHLYAGGGVGWSEILDQIFKICCLQEIKSDLLCPSCTVHHGFHSLAIACV